MKGRMTFALPFLRCCMCHKPISIRIDGPVEVMREQNSDDAVVVAGMEVNVMIINAERYEFWYNPATDNIDMVLKPVNGIANDDS